MCYAGSQLVMEGGATWLALRLTVISAFAGLLPTAVAAEPIHDAVR
jgi:hypothetical protein